MRDRPAILGGTPVRAGKRWPNWPQWDDGERHGLSQVLESGDWSSLRGDETRSFAAEFAAFQGCRQGLCLTNGSHALEAALIASEVGEGDEVIVPAITFVATATAVLAVNARPVIVDVDPASLCIDPEAAEAAIGPRTRAIIPVHIAGRACDMDALTALCRRHRLALVEDCAHAPGTRWRGRGVGSFGGVGAFSFESSKLISAGEGGAVLTDRSDLYERAWSYVNCGRVIGRELYHHGTLGANLRMTEWQSAILRSQLRRYPEHQRQRQERAAQLDEAFAGLAGLTPQSEDPRMDTRAHYAYVFHYDEGEFAGLSTTAFANALAAEGIAVGRPYPSVSKLEMFQTGNFAPRLRRMAPDIDYKAVQLPGAEQVEARSVWLHHPTLLGDPDDVGDIVEAITRIRTHAAALRRWSKGPRYFALRAAHRVRGSHLPRVDG